MLAMNDLRKTEGGVEGVRNLVGGRFFAQFHCQRLPWNSRYQEEIGLLQMPEFRASAD